MNFDWLVLDNQVNLPFSLATILLLGLFLLPGFLLRIRLSNMEMH